jgi:glycosyltransferase involved in cell wall biosynthesis
MTTGSITEPVTESKHRPKVLIVGPTPPPHHGMTTATAALLGSPTLNASYQVLHLDNADRRSQDNMGRLDVRNVILGLRHAAVLAGMLIRHRPDLLYLPVSQNRWAYVRDAVFIILARLTGVRVLTHLNGAGFRDFYDSTDPVTRLVVRSTSRLLHGAAVLGEGLRGIYGGLVAEDRVHVLPNGIPDPFPGGPPARNGARGEPGGVEAGAVRITYLGTLIRSKGFPELLAVAARLRDAGVAAKFVFAGAWNSDGERSEAEELVARLELGAVVEFVGVVAGDEKRRVLAEADVFVLPTRYPPEGQPFAILEAMAAGLPVVSTPRGAIPDMVEDGVTGLLLPEGDEAALLGGLRRLVESPAERWAMGAAARSRYQRMFTEEATTRRLVAVMDSVRGGVT